MKGLTIASSLALTLIDIAAAPAVIGTVSASGAFRLNGDTVIANGTLMEGALIETGNSNSSVRLTGGPLLLLGPGSRAKFYSSRMVLEKGDTRLEGVNGFQVESLGLTIRPDHGSAAGQISFMGPKRLRVSALTGSLRVLNAEGILVANVAAGSAFAFEPQDPAAKPMAQVTGILTEQNGRFLLTDQVTHVTVEIRGPGLRALVGRMVQVTGRVNPDATPAGGAAEVVDATKVQATGSPGGGGGAAAAGTGGATSGGAIGVTTVAIVGGVAVAATIGGLAASGALSDETAPVSR